MNRHHVVATSGPDFVGETGETAGPNLTTVCWKWTGNGGNGWWERVHAYDASATGGLPTDAAARKAVPIATGVLDYFPDAIAEVARVSKVGNDQHNPGQPLHWAKEKSSDEADALVRHLLERGKRDVDGMRHTAKVAWRALALLQRELDAER